MRGASNYANDLNIRLNEIVLTISFLTMVYWLPLICFGCRFLFLLQRMQAPERCRVWNQRNVQQGEVNERAFFSISSSLYTYKCIEDNILFKLTFLHLK
jgi:hypothetical protein